MPEKYFFLVVVQSLSHIWLCNPMNCSMPDIAFHHYVPDFAQTQVHWVSDTIQPSHPLSSPFPPVLNLSEHEGLSKELTLSIKWPKYWSFSFSLHPSNEYSGLTSFRMNWLDLLAVQGLSRVFSNTTVQKHQLFGDQPSLWYNSHILIWLLEKS